MLSKYYRNKVSLEYLLKAPLGILHFLYYKAVIESQTEEGRKNHAAEELEDALGGG